MRTTFRWELRLLTRECNRLVTLWALWEIWRRDNQGPRDAQDTGC
jgi:hypothetical protein